VALSPGGSEMPSRSQKAVFSSLAEAHAQVEAAQAAVTAGELLRAVACLEEARARQREAVAALVVDCWQAALVRAADEDTPRREEALAHLVRLADTVFGTLCTECRHKIGDLLQPGKR
jgi:hypothetical protein